MYEDAGMVQGLNKGTIGAGYALSPHSPDCLQDNVASLTTGEESDEIRLNHCLASYCGS